MPDAEPRSGDQIGVGVRGRTAAEATSPDDER
jgi:hypothetical protein